MTDYDPVKRRRRREERYAQRTLREEGYWFSADAIHGTISGYDYWGCRCPRCAEVANRRRRCNRDAQPDERLNLARAMQAEYQRQLLDRRRDLLVNRDGVMVTTADVEHGTQQAYGSYSCRCRECVDHSRLYAQRRRRRVVMNELRRLRIVANAYATTDDQPDAPNEVPEEGE